MSNVTSERVAKKKRHNEAQSVHRPLETTTHFNEKALN